MQLREVIRKHTNVNEGAYSALLLESCSTALQLHHELLSWPGNEDRLETNALFFHYSLGLRIQNVKFE